MSCPGCPDEWFVVFKERASHRLARWLPGRFKHCWCFAWDGDAGVWVFVDFSWQGGRNVAIVRDEDAHPWLAFAAGQSCVVKVKAGRSSWRPRGLTCVSAVAHVIGLPSCALRPDGLYRDCLAAGGEIVIAGEMHGRQGGGAVRDEGAEAGAEATEAAR